MSWWTYIHGTITVSPMGRTQAEKRYILETVLDHLPRVTGSERDMDVYIIQKNRYNSSCSHNEFGIWGGYLSEHNLSTEMQNEYILVVDAALRDCTFEETFKEFQKWIVRLAKRVCIENVLVEIKDYYKKALVRNENDCYGNMFEYPIGTYGNQTDEPAWYEYLMWEYEK